MILTSAVQCCVYSAARGNEMVRIMQYLHDINLFPWMNSVIIYSSWQVKITLAFN